MGSPAHLGHPPGPNLAVGDEVRYVPITNAPSVPVSLAFLPHGRESLMRQFIEAAVGTSVGSTR